VNVRIFLIALVLTLGAVMAGAALADRGATASERRAIIAADPYAKTISAPCLGILRIRVSTANPRYALVTLKPGRLPKACVRFGANGYNIDRRTGRRWAFLLSSGYDAAPCDLIGRRVARDLLPGVPCR
jgi:hypothetical protein